MDIDLDMFGNVLVFSKTDYPVRKNSKEEKRGTACWHVIVNFCRREHNPGKYNPGNEAANYNIEQQADS